MGHSMGGHGALTIALKNPDSFKSCSAFAPICQPSQSEWSAASFEKYLGLNQANWRAYDASLLIEDGARFSEFFVDQGLSDSFLEEGLRPKVLEAACAKVGIPLTLRMQEGYDHSYNFISTFMEDHISWHARRLR
jgi:S-formylglutathione hydrolase